MVVKTLAALLRLADSLDRNHAQFVTGLKAECTPQRIIIHLETSGPVLREVASAYKKADLAQAVFHREIVFIIGNDTIARDSDPPPVDL